MTEHRVPMLGAALRRRTDPARSSDPQIRQLVAALADLEVAPAPRPDFKAELRAQLVAVTPRLVEEGEPNAVTATRPARRPAAAGAPRRSGFRLAKPLIAVTSVLAAFVLLLGGAVLMSRSSLPGDSLYGLKRASEDTQYGLTGGTVAKGQLKLEFAGRRIGEVASLLPRAGALAAGTGAIADNGQVNQHTASLIRSTLSSADGDVHTASRMLGGAAVQQNSAKPLAAVTTWAPDQLVAMRGIVARIPAGALHDRAVTTLDLIVAAQRRAATLASELGCSCLGSSGTDQLGPIPCATTCSPAAARTTPAPKPATHTPSRHTSSGVPVKPLPTATATQGTRSSSSTPAPGRPSTSPPVSSPATPGVPVKTTPTAPALPTLPGLGSFPAGHATATPTVPITVNSCGLQASLGPINIGIGGC